MKVLLHDPPVFGIFGASGGARFRSPHRSRSAFHMTHVRIPDGFRLSGLLSIACTEFSKPVAACCTDLHLAQFLEFDSRLMSAFTSAT